MSDIENTFWQNYDSSQVQVFGINVGENISTAITFKKNFGLTYPVLHDQNSSVYQKYFVQGISPYPRDAIIDQNGILRYIHSEYDPHYMRHIVDELLETTVIPGPQVKANIPRKFDFNLYPNPFNTELHVSFDKIKSEFINIEITDLHGKIIKRIKDHMNLPGKNKYYNIDMKSYASGIYLISVTTKQFRLTKKAILIK